MPASLTMMDDDTFVIQGDLDFQSVATLWDSAVKLSADHNQLKVDLNQVQRSDSSGVALLVEWLRLAQKNQQEILFMNTPEQMRAIIQVAELEKILPLSESPLKEDLLDKLNDEI